MMIVFEMTNYGEKEINFFLGMEVKQDEKETFIT